MGAIKRLLLVAPTALVIMALSLARGVIITKYDPGKCTCENDIITCVKDGVSFYTNGCAAIDILVLINDKLVKLPFISPDIATLLLIMAGMITGAMTALICIGVRYRN